jgi:cytochrome c551/c552
MKTTRWLAAFGLVSTIAFAAPVSITLPPDTSALKPSPLPGYAVAQQKCGICHSADYVDYQPPNMTLVQWTAEMKKMKALYGAPIDDREIELLAVYLTTTYGDAKTAEAPPPAPPAPPVVTTGVADLTQLLTDNGCLACHANDRKIVGPAYHDVAARYRGDASAVATLTAHIRDGGTGRWGTVPMPPFANLTVEQATQLAVHVLAQ